MSKGFVSTQCARISAIQWKYQTSHTPFYSGFESVANIVFSFETSFWQRSIQSHLTVAITKGN